MRCWKLDRQIIIQQKAITQDTTGDQQPTFTTLATVSAEVRYPKGLEKYEQGRDTATGRIEFIIRFRSDVTEKMQVSFDGFTWNITSIQHFGRQEGTTLVAHKKF